MGGDNTWSAWGWGDIHVISRHSNLLVSVQDIHTQSLTTTFFYHREKEQTALSGNGLSTAQLRGRYPRLGRKDQRKRQTAQVSLIMVSLQFVLITNRDTVAFDVQISLH